MANNADEQDGGERSKEVQNGKDRAFQYKGVCLKCGATRTDQQIGLEKTPAEYVARLVSVFQEVRRVLRDDGTLWLNLGDSYAAQRGGTMMPAESLAGGVSGFMPDGSRINRDRYEGYSPSQNASAIGFKHKDLMGIPWRVAFALQADGWYLRQDIIWHKPNPMPESVTDRCTKAHEYIFLMSKSPRYYFDSQAIAEPLAGSSIERLNQPNIDNQAGSDRVPGKTNGAMKAVARGGVNAFRGQGHFRDGENGPANRDGRDMKEVGSGATRNKRSVWTVTTRPFKEAHFATFPPKLIEPCILAGCPVGGLVLDPFNGSGTAGVVALQNGRRYVGCELNEAYLDMSIARIKTEANAPRLPGFDEAMQGAAKAEQGERETRRANADA